MEYIGNHKNERKNEEHNEYKKNGFQLIDLFQD